MESGNSLLLSRPVFDKTKAGFKLFDELQEVHNALEPSNIIWENIPVTRATRNCSKLKVFFKITALLLAILYGVIWLKIQLVGATAANSLIRQDCSKISKLFENKEKFHFYAR